MGDEHPGGTRSTQTTTHTIMTNEWMKQEPDRSEQPETLVRTLELGGNRTLWKHTDKAEQECTRVREIV